MNQITLRCQETAALVVFDPEMSKLQMSATTLKLLVDKPSLADPENRDDEPRVCARAHVFVYMCIHRKDNCQNIDMFF